MFCKKSGGVFTQLARTPDMKRTILLATITTFALPAFAQVSDAPPVDAGQLLQSLKQIREINATGIKSRRSHAYSQVSAAAQSAEKAVALWKDAVKAVQFEGAKNEGAAMQNWREGEGDALGSKLCSNAVKLHLQWLVLSFQHAGGTEVKQLLPQIIEYTKQIQQDEAAAEHLDDQLKREHERGGPHQKQNIEDAAEKRMHDRVMRTSILESPIARWLQIGEHFGQQKGKQKDESAGWEMIPGNLDGIYQSILLPHFRAAKDMRLLEYWELAIRRETDRAAERRLDIEQREWTQVKRPALLWARSQDALLLGLRNRAISEMFSVLKTFPHHPEAKTWVALLEETIKTPASASSPTTPEPVALPVPRASVPPSAAPVPTATIVPVPQKPAASTR